MRRLAAATLLAFAALASRTSEGRPPVESELRAGEAASLDLSEATRAASAVLDVPAGVEALHVFVSIGSPSPLTVEEGPVDGAGAFTEVVRERKFDGRAHVVRRTPSPGRHRIVVTSGGPLPDDAVVEIEFDRPGEPPIVDLERDRLPGSARRFRLYVPPHDGVAELHARGSPNAVQVLVRGPDGVLGKPSKLPLSLAGSEPGGLFGVDVLRGSPEALARVRLTVPRVGDAPIASAESPRPLVVGTPARFSLGGSALSDQAAFELVVSDASPGLRLTATATREGKVLPDPDVYVRRGKAVDEPMEDADFAGVGRGPHETLHLGGTAGLSPGVYHVLVELPEAELPAELTLVVEPLAKAGPPFPVISPLPLDTFVAGELHAFVDPSLVQWYDVAVPAGAESLRVQVVDATSDVDLVAVDPRTGVIVERSLAFQIDESLVVSLPPSPPTSYAIGVLSRDPSEDDVGFRVAAAVDRAPTLPADLRLPPFVRSRALTPTEAVAAAVAEVQVVDGTGSAVCIGTRGYLLTCLHVVLDEATDQPTKEAILVAFPDDFRRAPRQSFRARVVESDAKLDLALLKIESDVYARPVARDISLPVVPMGDADAVRLGDVLLVVGYPGDGSEHSRPPVTVSRGVVAGLEADRERLLWIKTDSWMATGHSGGAVLDAGGRLVGLAAATLGDHDAMGLVRPTSLVPAAWLREAGVSVPSGTK